MKEVEPQILLVQRCLQIVYPESDVIDNGIYAQFTQRAVLKFQEDNELKPDGCVNTETWSLLRCNLFLSSRMSEQPKRTISH